MYPKSFVSYFWGAFIVISGFLFLTGDKCRLKSITPSIGLFWTSAGLFFSV